jgi:hypothetical protein
MGASATASKSEDLIYLDFVPERELESANHLLDDHAALMQFYEDNGYILLRNVLNPESVERARDEVLAVIASYGIVEEGDPAGTWTGRDVPYGMEWSPKFAGISRRMIEQPDNLRVMEKLLGEAPSLVPNVQYRTYAPKGMVTKIHQDGAFASGVDEYKPVWTPLTPCPRAKGGVVIAVGQNNRGSLHDFSKQPPYPIPADAIPDDAWATTDYMPGDVLVLHGFTPHGSMPNETNEVRVSIDARVQSAAHPTCFVATVKAATPESITVDTDFEGELTFRVDDGTFIHLGEPGIGQPRADLAENAKVGDDIVVVRNGDYAPMLRCVTG